MLSAGTLGSTEILLRSREEGLPVSDSLGQRFSADGDIIAFALGGRARERHRRGPSAEIRRRRHRRLRHRRDRAARRWPPRPLMFIQEGVLPWRSRRFCPCSSSRGAGCSEPPQSLIKGVYHGPVAILYTFFVVSPRRGEGPHQRCENGHAQGRVAGRRRQPVYARVDEALTKAAASVGARYIKSPLAATSMGTKPATAHPLGGCGMGDDARSGVVDHECRVSTAWARAACTPGSMCATARSSRARSGSIRSHHHGVAERAMVHLPAITICASTMRRFALPR